MFDMLKYTMRKSESVAFEMLNRLYADNKNGRQAISVECESMCDSCLIVNSNRVYIFSDNSAISISKDKVSIM